MATILGLIFVSLLFARSLNFKNKIYYVISEASIAKIITAKTPIPGL